MLPAQIGVLQGGVLFPTLYFNRNYKNEVSNFLIWMNENKYQYITFNFKKGTCLE